MPTPHIAPTILKMPTPAFRHARLVDFVTGSDEPRPEHRAWLTEAAGAIPLNRNFEILIVGYASKLHFQGQDAADSDASNVRLSFNRANKVARLLELVNPRVTTRIERFEARGNHDYRAPSGDNDGYWRAVEVHIYLDSAPSTPPELRPLPPCPGGVRTRQWSVACPAGFNQSVLPGAVVGANLLVFRNEEGRPRIHGFMCPAAGVGFSLLPKLGAIKDFLKAIFGGLNLSPASFTRFTAETAFNFGDLDGATCVVASGGVGAGVGAQLAKISVSGQVWFRGSNGKCMLATKPFFTNVDASGKDVQFGGGASGVGGPLIRLS